MSADVLRSMTMRAIMAVESKTLYGRCFGLKTKLVIVCIRKKSDSKVDDEFLRNAWENDVLMLFVTAKELSTIHIT